MRAARKKVVIAGAVTVALALPACVEGDRGEPGAKDDVLVFGTVDEPATLDPTFARAGESSRAARQIFETLVRPAPGGTELVGGLAHTFVSDETGTVWTFELTSGVRFHDGTPLTAEAVCRNFDRWYRLTGSAQDPDLTPYWQSVFEGFADNQREGLAESRYRSCTALAEHTAVIELTRASGRFPAALALPAFAIHSPAALAAYDADTLGQEDGHIRYPEYGRQHPTGTGPFKLDSWDQANQEITLARNEDYWGDTAAVPKLIFRTIPDPADRRRALLAGEIDGYDLPPPVDHPALRDAGMSLSDREAVNLLYLGFVETANPALAKLEVRQAIAYALNRSAVVDEVLPAGSRTATQFQPPALSGWNPNLITYDHDPDRARQLLAGADEGDLTLRFAWPTGASWPYLPAADQVFERFQADLAAVGITVEPVPLSWGPDYPVTVRSGTVDLYLLGRAADYPDGHDFIGNWFQRSHPAWGFDYPELFERVAQADQAVDPETRHALYQELNAMIMEYLPGVPIAHLPTSVVFAPYVAGVELSPLADDRFTAVRVDR